MAYCPLEYGTIGTIIRGITGAAVACLRPVAALMSSDVRGARPGQDALLVVCRPPLILPDARDLCQAAIPVEGPALR